MAYVKTDCHYYQGCRVIAFLEPYLQQRSLLSFVFAFCFLCLLNNTTDNLALKMQ